MIQSNQYVEFPVGNTLVPKEQPKSVPFTFDWSVDSSYLVDLQIQQLQKVITFVQTVWVDNSDNDESAIVEFALVKHRIVVAAGWQGYFPVMVSGTIRFTATSSGTGKTQVALLNVAVAGASWGPGGSGVAGVTSLSQGDGIILTPNPITGVGVVAADTSIMSALAWNYLINSDFRINQREYVSGAVLAAGSFGHDRFKAGAGGGDYTFTQLASSTEITILPGKSLIQIIEDCNVGNSSYTLSWEGTAQARFGIDSATPSGTYAASPITINTQTPSTVMSVEFNEGTLGKAVLVAGVVPGVFIPRSMAVEFALCQRYFEVLNASENPLTAFGVAQTGSTSRAIITLSFQTQKRVPPTVSFSSISHWAFYNAALNNFAPWATQTPQTTKWGFMSDVHTTNAIMPAAGGAALMTPNGSTPLARMYFDAEI